jgi:hypothetical protein
MGPGEDTLPGLSLLQLGEAAKHLTNLLPLKRHSPCKPHFVWPEAVAYTELLLFPSNLE